MLSHPPALVTTLHCSWDLTRDKGNLRKEGFILGVVHLWWQEQETAVDMTSIIRKQREVDAGI